jgi:hypothetical protein
MCSCFTIPTHLSSWLLCTNEQSFTFDHPLHGLSRSKMRYKMPQASGAHPVTLTRRQGWRRGSSSRVLQRRWRVITFACLLNTYLIFMRYIVRWQRVSYTEALSTVLILEWLNFKVCILQGSMLDRTFWLNMQTGCNTSGVSTPETSYKSRMISFSVLYWFFDRKHRYKHALEVTHSFSYKYH